MFQRADQILAEKKEDDFPLHALDFSWEGFEPSLSIFDSRDGEVSELDLDDIDFLTSRKKTCIGYFDGEKYVACPKNAPVEKYAQCPDCSKEVFLPFQDCVFEPQCDGERCGIDFCKREHVLYIAFYDTRMKIGMSSTRRVERRLIEQGADAFAIIGKRPTRLKARTAEKEISARLGIPQALRYDSVLRNFARKVDSDGIVGRYEGLRITLGETYQMEPEPLRWLNKYPIELPLPRVPQLEDSCGKHKGRLVGLKGRWLIFESEGLKALNMSDFPARFLSRDD
jgi:hypothetical protein